MPLRAKQRINVLEHVRHHRKVCADAFHSAVQCELTLPSPIWATNPSKFLFLVSTKRAARVVDHHDLRRRILLLAPVGRELDALLGKKRWLAMERIESTALPISAFRTSAPFSALDALFRRRKTSLIFLRLSVSIDFTSSTYNFSIVSALGRCCFLSSLKVSPPSLSVVSASTANFFGNGNLSSMKALIAVSRCLPSMTA